MALNSLFGQSNFGGGYFGGTPGQYLDSNVLLERTSKKYLSSTTTLLKKESQFLDSNIELQYEKKQYLDSLLELVYTKKEYLDSFAELVYTKEKYLPSDTLLEATARRYLNSTIFFIYDTLLYEVEEFQVIVNDQTVKFYWRDAAEPTKVKTYNIYESSDSGKTWTFIDSTTAKTYELPYVPFRVQDKIYKIIISTGMLVSYGSVSYPSFTYQDRLHSLDNGYWDINPTTNLFNLYEGIDKESICRAELETDHTANDYSITKIRNNRISDVYGKTFNQESLSVGENYRRKIWNLFIGHRNTTTYDSLYSVVKAFTSIPPRISPLSEDGWVLGKRYLGKDTIPLSELSALYGVSLKVHLFKRISGTVDTVVLSTSKFTATSTEIFSSVNNAYKDKYVVFSNGNNGYFSRKVLAYNGTTFEFTTEAFPFTIIQGDDFFITDISTDIIKTYVKQTVNLHSIVVFKFFSKYIPENYETGFSGGVYNLELLPSRRLGVINTSNTVDDGGKLVQAMYISGSSLSQSFPLAELGGQGIVCWDTIKWDSNTEFKMYLSFSGNYLDADSWVAKSGVNDYLKFDDLQERDLGEFVKTNSEVLTYLSNTFIRDVDYLIDYRLGTIKRTVNSSLPINQYVSITYDLEWKEVKQNETIQFTKDYFKYKFIVSNVQNTDDFEFSGMYLKNLT